MIPKATVAHYQRIQQLQALGVLVAAELWREVSLADLSGSWAAYVPTLAAALTPVQVEAASAGAAYGAATLAQQDLYVAPDAFVNPSAFGGFASDGRSLEGLLYAPVPYVKTLIGGGMDMREALAAGGKHLTGIMRTQVADAGRAAGGVDIAARRGTGYARMLNPPSCSRCSVLAGRFYRWNDGFQRHPRCDCVHVASTAGAVKGGSSEGLMHDPYEYFRSLPDAEQDKVYGKGEAQAIRDGADLFQVVNARRGVSYAGVSADGTRRGQARALNTSEGTSRRGNFGNTRGARMTPEGIYAQQLPRAETLKLLESNGFILPGGQDPAGVIRGQREGFGALGRGGVNVGASEAVRRARESGVREPGTRATMTAAERRTFDAQANWDAVREGRNPFTNKKGVKVTPEQAARVEREYRKHILGY